MFWMAIWIGSTAATLIIAIKYSLAKPYTLAFGNMILPGLGLFYTLYLVHIYLPRREGRIPPVLIFIRVFTEELTKSFKKWCNKKKR